MGISFKANGFINLEWLTEYTLLLDDPIKEISEKFN
jgi:hypothetical protein